MSYAVYEDYGTTTEEKKMETQIVEIQSLQHKRKILKDYGVVVVLVYATWCGPCKLFKPEFYRYAKQHVNEAYFVQENNELKLTNVEGYPSMAIYKRGQLIGVIKGGNLQSLDKVLSK